METTMQKVHSLLCVAGTVCDMRMCAIRNGQRNTVLLRIDSHVNLIVMEVCACRQQRRITPKPMRMQILCVESFLIPRIMLLNSIAVYGVIQKKSEVRVQVEQRTAQEPVGLKTVS